MDRCGNVGAAPELHRRREPESANNISVKKNRRRRRRRPHHRIPRPAAADRAGRADRIASRRPASCARVRAANSVKWDSPQAAPLPIAIGQNVGTLISDSSEAWTDGFVGMTAPFTSTYPKTPADLPVDIRERQHASPRHFSSVSDLLGNDPSGNRRPVVHQRASAHEQPNVSARHGFLYYALLRRPEIFGGI